VIVLGLDTSGYINALGIVDGKRVLVDKSIPARTDSLEQIVANIHDVLKEARLTLAQVEAIGVGLGPGSWTGIRVGVTVGKMLAWAAGKPAAGIPTLEALAYGAGDENRLVCSVISVGAGDAVYAGLYHNKSGGPTQEGDYYVGDISGLAALIKEPCTVAGADVKACAERIRQITGQAINTLERQPSGAAVAALAEGRLAGGKADNVLGLVPLYLKESTAKVFVNKYAQQPS
jgi:tRNA threonylcarbamoyladenosine biosynthesis protein TsaB